jgi:HK97 family phage portal protein
MGLLFGKRDFWGISSVAELIPPRTGLAPGYPMPLVTADRAMRQSAVWACLRLRADLVSTLPLDVYRMVTLAANEPPMQIEAPKTPILVNPGGEKVCIGEWLYMSQIELDRTGNAIGLIREVDLSGYPIRIDLKASASCAIRVKDGEIYEYIIDGVTYQPQFVWHEKQYPVAGLQVGLSPIAYAAYTLGEYFSIQEFATAWFSGGAVPRSRLKNVEKKIAAKEATVVKEAWRASQAMGEPFVHGSDWEYSLIQADQASADWLEAKRYTDVDIARFMGCPADLVDAAVSGQSVTYANITERNLQFLIMNLGPAIMRREGALTNAIPRPRFVKLNSDALLRMDPASRAKFIKTQIDSRVLAPSEARALDNRPPFTDAQIKEFEDLGLNKTASAAVGAIEGEITPPASTPAPAK